MTTRERFEAMIAEYFKMTAKEAKEQMDKLIPVLGALGPRHKVAWNGPANDYPEMMYLAYWLNLKDIVEHRQAQTKAKAV